MGCYICNVFFACFGYADDLLLLSASRSGLQELVKICEIFAKKKCLKFSTNINPDKSKTKCLIFSKRKVDSSKVPPVVLNGDPLPWVSQVKHLGNTLQCDNTMRTDLAQKRGKLIGKLNSLSQEFYFVDPAVYVKILNTYAASFYGSSLWDLYSKDCERLFSAWNVAIRICFDVDRSTHRYFIEELSGSLHPKVMLCSRYSSFHQSLLICDKFPVRFLARLHHHDQRTVFGRTLLKIAKDCNNGSTLQPFPSKSLVKKTMKYFAVPDVEKWRPCMLKELLDVKNYRCALPGFSSEEVSSLLKFVCTS